VSIPSLGRYRQALGAFVRDLPARLAANANANGTAGLPDTTEGGVA
jgi:hypothetical protein